MDGDPIRAWTGRRRTRPTSAGCRNPQQPEPGGTPLSAAYAAVQTNRATSEGGAPTGLDGRARSVLLTRPTSHESMRITLSHFGPTMGQLHSRGCSTESAPP